MLTIYECTLPIKHLHLLLNIIIKFIIFQYKTVQLTFYFAFPYFDWFCKFEFCFFQYFFYETLNYKLRPKELALMKYIF